MEVQGENTRNFIRAIQINSCVQIIKIVTVTIKKIFKLPTLRFVNPNRVCIFHDSWVKKKKKNEENDEAGAGFNYRATGRATIQG